MTSIAIVATILLSEVKLFKSSFDNSFFEVMPYPENLARKYANVAPWLSGKEDRLLSCIDFKRKTVKSLASVRFAALVDKDWLIIDKWGIARYGIKYGIADVIALEEQLLALGMKEDKRSTLVSLFIKNNSKQAAKIVLVSGIILGTVPPGGEFRTETWDTDLKLIGGDRLISVYSPLKASVLSTSKIQYKLQRSHTWKATLAVTFK